MFGTRQLGPQCMPHFEQGPQLFLGQLVLLWANSDEDTHFGGQNDKEKVLQPSTIVSAAGHPVLSITDYRAPVTLCCELKCSSVYSDIVSK